jgi:peptidoglycan-associated lipoprotein
MSSIIGRAQQVTYKFIAIGAVLLIAGCASDPVPPPPPPPPPPAPVVQAPPPPPAPTIVPGSVADFEENVGDRVFFDYDGATLDQTDLDTLGSQAAWLNQFPNVVLTIEGHCDERGTREYNLALGARRAAAVREHLISLGVSAARVETISYGSERPTCAASAENCWQENRRGVATIRGGAAS